MSLRVEGFAKPRVSHACDTTAYVGNDAFECRTLDIGMDGLSVITKVCRTAGEFVRVSVQLGERGWIDLDAVIVECVKAQNGWCWQLQFVRLDQPQTVAIDSFVQSRRPRTDSRPVSRPSPATSTTPPSRSSVRARDVASQRELRDLYREALADLDTDAAPKKSSR
jgi:hypothetical protein